MILTLQTTTFSAHGGIPTYNRMICRALNDFADSDCERRVLIAMDSKSDAKLPAQALSNLSFEVFSGDRLAFARRVIAITMRQRVDLLLIGHVNYAPLGLLLKCLRPSLRYGVMLHGIEAWKRLPLLKRLALRRADFMTSVSEFTKATVAELNGVKYERIRVVPDTIDWNDEISEERGGTASGRLGKPLLLSVARLEASEKYKGIDTVIAALPSAIERVPELQYVLIGSGNDLKRHQQMAEDLRVADRVSFLGEVDTPTLRRYYQSCDVFVLPSDGEGFGIVYLEAMHYGKPIIAANSRAVPEVVKHSETGLLVKYGATDELADAIVSLCLNESLRERLGNAGRRRLREKFSFESFRQRLHDVILHELEVSSPLTQERLEHRIADAKL